MKILSKFILLLLIITYHFTFAGELTEKNVLILAIQKKNSFKNLSLNRSIDSLTIQKSIINRYPKITTSIEPSIKKIHPNQQINESIQFNPLAITSDTISLSPNASLDTKIELHQELPGGGNIEGSIEGSTSKTGDANYLFHSSRYSLSYSQPLLKNAWKWGDLNHSYKIATMHDEELSFETKKQLLSQLSEMRNIYWTIYEKKALLSLYSIELQRAEDLFQIEKVRIKIGEATILDSLNAALNVLSAQQAVMDANINFETSINEISVSLSISPDTIWIDDSSDISIFDLPDDTTLMLLIEQYNPSLKEFQKITERLCLDHDRLRHNTYPDIIFKAGLNHNRSGDRLFSDNDASVSNALIGLILSYSFPLKQQYIVQAQSRYEFQKNEINHRQYRLELASKLRNLKLSWKKELNRLHLLKQIVDLSRQQFYVAQKQYEIGQINRMELSEAKNKILKSDTDYLSSRIQMKRLEIIMDELTGTLFEKFNIIVK